MNKNIIICCMATVCALFLNSCAELMQVANYTANTWVQTMDNKGLSTPDNTLHANAWLSGTGGKVMVAGDVLTSIIGDVLGKDMSGVKNIIRGSMNNIVSEPNASKSDKANIVGSLFALGGNIANHFESKNFEKEVAAFNEFNSNRTDPESSLYDPYFDCRYVIDYDKKSIRKQDDYKELAECIRGISQAKYESELDEILQENYGISYKKYSELPITKRPSLAEIVSKSEGTIFENNVKIPIQQDVQSTELLKQEQQKIAEAQRQNDIVAIEQTVGGYVLGGSKLLPAQKAMLDEKATLLKKHPTMNTEIEGHTCNLGTRAFNLRLGEARANSAKTYLVEKGIEEERLTTISKGEDEPLVPNTSKENREQNRRVEFKVTGY